MPKETRIGAVVFVLGALMLAASYQMPDGKAEALTAGGGGACLFAGGVYAFLTWIERPKRKPESKLAPLTGRWVTAMAEYDERMAEKKAAEKCSEALDTPPSEEASAYIADRLKKDDSDEG